MISEQGGSDVSRPFRFGMQVSREMEVGFRSVYRFYSPFAPIPVIFCGTPG